MRHTRQVEEKRKKERINPGLSMKRSLFMLVLALLCTSGCASMTAQKVGPTDVLIAQQEIPEDELMDVGVVVFDGEELTAEEARKQGTHVGVRKAEKHFMPYHLKTTMQRSSHWGMVRIVPQETAATDLVVKGKIVASNGENLIMQVEARDSSGKLWLEKTYHAEAQLAQYVDLEPAQKDAFQDLYNTVANDLAAIRLRMTPEERKNIRTLSKLLFAGDFAPDPFADYLATDRKGIRTLKRLPAQDDAMMSRVLKIREREEMFFDALNGYYEVFYADMWPSYENWRKANLTERAAVSKIKRDAYLRQAAGILLVALAVFLDAGDVIDGNLLTGAMVLAGGQVFISGINISKEAQIHRAAVEELGESFDSEMKPVVLDLEGKTYELTGSAEDQYKRWKELLRRIYFTETGFEKQE